MADFCKTDSFVCVDLETTGLNPKMDKIVEIGAVRVENGVQTEVFEAFVNPGRSLSDTVIGLTGIKDEMIKDAPDIAEVLPRFLQFAKESVLVGHSVLFDYSFLKKAAVNNRLEFEREGIDTLKIARRYLAGLTSRRLDFLCGHYGIPHRAHRALEDAKATCMLYQSLLREFSAAEDAENYFSPQRLLYKVKRETPVTNAQKERLYKLLQKHKLIAEYDLDKLTRNEASRYTDLLLAKYGR